MQILELLVLSVCLLVLIIAPVQRRGAKGLRVHFTMHIVGMKKMSPIDLLFGLPGSY